MITLGDLIDSGKITAVVSKKDGPCNKCKKKVDTLNGTCKKCSLKTREA